jgi:hypothetical protein
MWSWNDSLFIELNLWRLPDILLLKMLWYCYYALSYRDLEEVMAQRTLRLSKLEHSPQLPWQRLCRERFAIATEDIYVVEV